MSVLIESHLPSLILTHVRRQRSLTSLSLATDQALLGTGFLITNIFSYEDDILTFFLSDLSRFFLLYLRHVEDSYHQSRNFPPSCQNTGKKIKTWRRFIPIEIEIFRILALKIRSKVHLFRLFASMERKINSIPLRSIIAKYFSFCYEVKINESLRGGN